jgi:prolyl 4-hydroxylase
MDFKPQKISQNVTLYSSDPIIYVVSNFISDSECQAFIDVGRDNMERATVISDGEHEVHASRTNSYCWVQHDNNDLVHEVSKRFSILVKMPINNAEQFQLVHYGPGTEYKPHFDAFDKNTEEGKKNWFPGGQRMITALAYLNDVEEGGETSFPDIGVSVKPNKGDVVVFHNCIDGTSDINPNSLHGGSPVLKGEKWAVNLWFRQEAIY